jgi:hypothetical protein
MYTASPQLSEEDLQNQPQSTIFRRSLHSVGQDSIADDAMRPALGQPASERKSSRPRQLRKKSTHAQNVTDGKNRTEPTTIHLEPILKQQLRMLAAGQTDPKLTSLSGIAVALIKRGLFAEPDKPYGPSLEPVVQGAIDKGFTRHDNRLAALQARDTRDSAQTLYLLVQTVSLMLEVVSSLRRETLEPDAFDRIIHASEQHARQALTHPDPYLLELVRNTYFQDGGKEEPAA